MDNELIPELERNNKCVCIKITLFGATCENDIVHELLKVMLRRIIKAEGGWEKYISFGVSNLSKYLNFNVDESVLLSLLIDNKEKLSKSFSGRKVVYIFDDFERSCMEEQTLLGCLYKVTKDCCEKALVVCNEDYLLDKGKKDTDDDKKDTTQIGDSSENSREKYLVGKEKIIGYELTITGNIKNIFDEVVDDIVKDEHLKAVIQLRKWRLINFFHFMSKDNIRTLKFALKRYTEICTKLSEEGLFCQRDSLYYYVLAHILENIFVTSIYYRDFGKKIEYELNDRVDNYSMLAKRVCEVGLDGLKTITFSSLPNSCVVCYNCVDEYVYDLCFEGVVWENFIKFTKENSPSEIPRINDITGIAYSENDEIAKERLDVVIEDLQKGLYKLSNYPYVYTEIIRLINVLFGQNDVSIVEKKVNGIVENNIRNYNGPKIDLHWYFGLDKDDEHQGFLYNLMRKREEELQDERMKLLRTKLLNNSDNFLEAIKEHVDMCVQHFGSTKKCLSVFPVDVIYAGIMQLKPLEVLGFESIVGKVYDLQCANLYEFYNEDESFIRELSNKISNSIGDLQDRKTQKYALENLVKFLTSVIKAISKNQE